MHIENELKFVILKAGNCSAEQVMEICIWTVLRYDRKMQSYDKIKDFTGRGKELENMEDGRFQIILVHLPVL